jgi:hypothetical protein
MADTKKRLNEAQKLLKQGVITEAEYEQRRQAILADTSAAKGSTAGGILKVGGIGCLSIIGGFVLLIVIIGVILVAAGGGGGGSTGGDDTRAAFAEGSSATVETAGNVKVKWTIDRIADPATSDNQFEQPASGNHYLVVGLTAENAGEPETNGSITSFRLRTRDGFEYERTFVSGVGAGIDTDVAQNLTSGGKVSGAIVFEVKDGSEIEWLKIDPNPFAGGDLYFDK